MKKIPSRSKTLAVWTFARTYTRSMALVTIGLLAAQTAHAADWYVDGLNGNNNNTGAAAAPFKDPWRAWSKAQPGDTIRLMPTVTYGYIYLGGKSGLPDAPITIRGADPKNLTKVSGGGTNYAIMLDGANYVNVHYFDMTAPGHGKYAGWSALYSKNNHHVTISHNYAHDSGCAGIQTHHSDYVNIMLNRVERNSKDTWNNIYCSGISNYNNLDSDTQTGTKMWIMNNIISGNTNTKSPQCVSPCTNSDGSGIIIDDSRRTQADYRAYKGKTLIQNNVIFNNGGRGIAIYYSDNVTVRSNTMFHNNQDPDEGSWRPGEVGITFSAGITVTNNVMVTDGLYGSIYTGKRVGVQATDNGGGSNLPIVIDYNQVFSSNGDASLHYFARNNTVSTTYGSKNKWGNPLFAKASIDPALADFRVKSTSPAVNFLAPSGMYSISDIFWTWRSTYPTAGAYQKTVN